MESTKNAATMAYMDRITLTICSSSLRSNVLSIASSQLYYLRLFQQFYKPTPGVRKVSFRRRETKTEEERRNHGMYEHDTHWNAEE